MDPRRGAAAGDGAGDEGLPVHVAPPVSAARRRVTSCHSAPSLPEEPDQCFVARPLELGDGPAGRLAVRAVDQLLPQLVGERRRFHPRPRLEQRRPELVEAVRHPAFAAGEVERQPGADDRPAQARAVHDRPVDLLDGRFTGGDHVQHLAPQRLLEPAWR